MSKIKIKLIILMVLILITSVANTIVKGVEEQRSNRILILYDQTTQTAVKWYNFLESYGYNVSIQPIQTVFATPLYLKNFNLIILDNSTNNLNGDRWKTEEYMIIADQNVPLIANGYAGWLILKLSGLNSMRIYDKTSYLKVNLEDYNLSIFHIPYELEFINQSSFLLFKISDIYYNSTFFLPSDINMLKTYFYRYTDCAIGKYEGYTNNLNIFFSFMYDPSSLSENGRRSYINLVEHALGKSEIREKTFIKIISEDIFFLNEEYTIIFKLTDEMGNGISALILIAFNETIKYQAYTNSEGDYLLNYAFNQEETGLISIAAYFEGNLIYEPSYSMKNIIVEAKRLTFLNLTGPVAAIYGEPANYSAILINEKGEALPGRRIEVYVNNTLLDEKVTDSTGKTIFEYTPTTSGRIVLKCVFNGEKQYQPSYSNELEYNITNLSLKNTFIILKIPQTTVVNEKITVETILIDESLNPLNSKDLYFLINGVLYEKSLTDLNGAKNFSLSFNQTGKYNITILYLGDGEYNKSVKNSLIVVDSIPTKLLLSIEKYTVDNIFKISLKLLTEGGQPINRQNIDVYLNGVRLQALTTDEEGIAKYIIKLGGELNKIKLEFHYNGSEVYKPCSEVCELTVEKSTPPESGIPILLAAITCYAITLTTILLKIRDEPLIF
ncbi:MAG: Ig-like domain-containing protein [Candidatus Odinarchaeum yellowstonii]|uniref:Ig-like domain-containing protein n=1 Tax=Odinarchaeota yellowstonii (strain LCB_4) TaxID=1841599 RepID=A0AAF0D2F9_ODILC|nr:MAG: Ig-like domain-containing protein [Candidatus Odinarchaeum yellowstonii]